MRVAPKIYHNIHSGPTLTAKQVAAKLNLDKSTVYLLARQGVIPSRQYGRSVRFETSDILEYQANKGPYAPAPDRSSNRLQMNGLN